MSKVEKNEANLNRCPCQNCPSYNDCAKGKTERLYCAGEIGKSACPYEKNGCICGDCPVHAENNLKGGYFCIFESADEADNKSIM